MVALMTEDEAKEKRCCGPEGTGLIDSYQQRYCIASDCMAWHWNRNPDHAKWHIKRPKHLQLEDGYCGLTSEVKVPSYIDYDLAHKK